MKFIILLFFTVINIVSAQKEFYKSKIEYTPGNLTNFYSSISSDENQIYFIANDYHVHAINKETGEKKWSYYLASKTNLSPVIFNKSLLVEKHFSEYKDLCIQLNCSTGDTIKTLKTNRFETRPLIKDNYLYGTAIIPGEGGSILKYDIDTNEIIWKEFIAHGVSKQPYFFKNHIVVNAESDNWFEINYEGKETDTICDNKNSLFVENIKCFKNYKMLSFDNKIIYESFLEKHFSETENFKFLSSDNSTVILANDHLLIIGKNLKIKQKIDLTKHIKNSSESNNEIIEILKISENEIHFFYKNNLIIYEINKKKIIKLYDLTNWNVHQILLDSDISKIWLISKNDGQLYGLHLN
jgi:predicted XRE-type DNA-binding protein